MTRQGQPEIAEPYLLRFLAIPGLETPTGVFVLPGYSGAAGAALMQWESSPSAEHRTNAQKAVRAIQGVSRIFRIGLPFALLSESWLAWLDSKPNRALKVGEQAIKAGHRFEMPYVEGLVRYQIRTTSAPGRSSPDRLFAAGVRDLSGTWRSLRPGTHAAGICRTA